jgi:hypothetical protein
MTDFIYPSVSESEGRRRLLVIGCLVLAILILCSPETAQLTPEQIIQLPLWGP